MDAILPPIDELLSERTTGKNLRKQLGSGVHAEVIMDRIIHNTIPDQNRKVQLAGEYRLFGFERGAGALTP